MPDDGYRWSPGDEEGEGEEPSHPFLDVSGVEDRSQPGVETWDTEQLSHPRALGDGELSGPHRRRERAIAEPSPHTHGRDPASSKHDTPEPFALNSPGALGALARPGAGRGARAAAMHAQQRFMPTESAGDRQARARRGVHSAAVLGLVIVMLVSCLSLVLIVSRSTTAGVGSTTRTSLEQSTATPQGLMSDTPTPTNVPTPTADTNGVAFGATLTPTAQPAASPTTLPTAVPNSPPTPVISPTPIPLPTATDTPNPTPTTPATATPTPTPTVVPTPSPTPNPFAKTASVSFARTSQGVNAGPALAACNGCGNNPGAATVRGTYANYGWHAFIAAGPWAAQAVPTSGSRSIWTLTVNSCVNPSVFGCKAPAGSQVVASSGRACTLQSDLGILPGIVPTGSASCVLDVDGTYSDNFVGAATQCHRGGTGGGSCTMFIAAQQQTAWGSWPGTTYYAPANCLSYGNSGRDARDYVWHQTANWLYAHSLPQVAEFSIWYPGPLECSDRVGNTMAPGSPMPGNATQFYQLQTVDGDRFTYSNPDSPAVQRARLSAAAPSGYITTNFEVCASPNLASFSYPTAHLSCAASGTARYNWTAGAQAQLARQIAGLTPAQAQQVVKNASGVNGGAAISITLTGGGTSLPTDATNITLIVRDN